MNRSHLTTEIASATKALGAGDYESVLQQTSALLKHLGFSPFPLPFAGGLPQADNLLSALGRKLHDAGETNPATSEGGDWILATSLYEFGGHTPVMRDLASALPGGLRGVALTLTAQADAQPTPLALARTGQPPASILRANAPTMLETCRNVLRSFGSHPPRRLFLFQHPEDTPAIAAAAALAAAGTELWLVHHSDMCPTAGLFLDDVRILDLTPRACAFTRHVIGLPSRWLPLTCADPGPSPPVFLRRGRLTTALSGSAFKTTQQSPCPYPEVVAALLTATGGTHVHIGPLDDAGRAAILDAVSATGLGADQFVHVPVVPTLVEGLRGEGVDLLLNTWPMGGARTAVEAMAAGVPVVWHAPNKASARYRNQMAYPGAAVWRRVSDLVALAKGADLQWLTAQSQAARRQFEALHHPSRWKIFFAAPDAAADPPLPTGFDASLFLPALWDTIVDLNFDTHEARFGVLRAGLRRQKENLSGLKKTVRELSALRQRLRVLESALAETRFPWPIRLWRRWRRNASGEKLSSPGATDQT